MAEVSCFLPPSAVGERQRAALLEPGADQAAGLARLAALYRIDALAGLRAAHHGWLGASFSAMELLTTIYHAFIPDPRRPVTERHALILSKGHAVMAQYAVLAGLGLFPRERLLTYKDWQGLPAHCDRAVPGIDTDSGSLGMGLSKGIGLALAHRAAGRPHRVFVILGDGELQEGQVFESLLTLRAQNLRSCLPIIDRNLLQTDSRTADIKDAEDWASVLRGIGFMPVSVDGHDPAALLTLLRHPNQGPRPLAVIAQTRKGQGSLVTVMASDTPRREGVWHGRIPDDREYLEILAELVKRVDDAELTEAWLAFQTTARAQSGRARPDGSPESPGPMGGQPGEGTRSAAPPRGTGRNLAGPFAQNPARPGTSEQAAVPGSSGRPVPVSAGARSTGDGFGEALVALAGRFPLFHVLDADLEKACRLTAFARAFPDRFLEVGISEQDMASIGAGFGLGGRIAVVNTYAAFLRRALDQMAAAAAERLPVIFAGHYAGLDYTTDGKSHQSLQDVGLARALGGLDVYEPLTADEAGELLGQVLARFTADLAAGHPSRPVYLRLHRTPVPDLPALMGGAPGSITKPGQAAVFRGAAPARGTLFVASPQFLALALRLQATLAAATLPLDVIGVSRYATDDTGLADLAREAPRPISLESHLPTGGLADLLRLWCREPLLALGPAGPTGSARCFADLLAAHHLREEDLLPRLRAHLDRP